MHLCRLILLGFSHRYILYAVKAHFQVLLLFLEFETGGGPKCFLTLLITFVIRFCGCVSNRPLSKRDSKALVSTVFVFLTFFLLKKSPPLYSSRLVLFQALHSVFKEHCMTTLRTTGSHRRPRVCWRDKFKIISQPRSKINLFILSTHAHKTHTVLKRLIAFGRRSHTNDIRS